MCLFSRMVAANLHISEPGLAICYHNDPDIFSVLIFTNLSLIFTNFILKDHLEILK